MIVLTLAFIVCFVCYFLVKNFAMKINFYYYNNRY